MTADEHSLVLDAELDEIGRSSDWAAEMAEKLDLPASLAYAVDVCFEEALTNVIVHGLKDAPPDTRQIRLTMTRQTANLRVVIEDQGVPFDPSQAQEPEVPADLDQAKIGGLGVHLMRKLASAMAYERDGGVNRLTLDFTLA